MKTLIIIWTSCFIIEAISLYFSYKSFLKAVKQPEFSAIISIFNVVKTIAITNSSGIKFKPVIMNIKRLLFNPYSYFIYALLLFIMSPFLIPFTIYEKIKKVLKIKTKLEKKIEQENEAQRISMQEGQDWLKNEGVITMEDIEIIGMADKNQKTLNDTDYSVRLMNVLMSYDRRIGNYTYLRDLSKFSKRDLLKSRNFGKRSLTELEEILNNEGYSLRD